MKHIHQIQAYILMYRKTEQRTGTGEPAPTDIPKKLESQSRAKGNLNHRPAEQQKRETPAPQPDSLIQSPGQNLPRRGSRDGGTNPIHRAESPTENQRGLDTLPSTHAYIPLVLRSLPSSRLRPQFPRMGSDRPVELHFRNTESADSIDELVRTLKSLGTAGGPTAQDPIKRTPEEGSDLIRIFPRMRSLYDTRKD